MSDIKILDCTWRDGGYLNDWKFGEGNIQSIISDLSDAGIDYVECGFLSDKVSYNPYYSLFNSTDSVKPLIKSDSKTKYTLMVNCGEYDFSRYDFDLKDVEIRIAFKKYNLIDLKRYLEPLYSNNIPFSLNAMHISLYSDEELKTLSDLSNDIKPTTLTGVDTMGIMTPSDSEHIYSFLDNSLSDGISLGFHSHDNLNLSMENVKAIIGLDIKREIIFDSCLAGIGRGGGMLNTHDIAIYLNDTKDSNYDLSLISDASMLVNVRVEDKYPYYIAAKCKCHPNYAKYLLNIGVEKGLFEDILLSVPDENKPYFSEKIISDLTEHKKNSLIFEEV
jgi:4-hydroxy 2-oxovalerate aldolase